MVHVRWSAVACASFVLFVVGCEQPCPSGKVRVNKVSGGSACVLTSVPSSDEPSDFNDTVSPAPAEDPDSVKIPPGTSAPPDSGASTPSPNGCRTEGAGDVTVHVVAKGGPPPVLASSSPPDGRYVLVQATWFVGDSAAPALSALRATVAVQGAVWVIGTRAVDGAAIGADESATLSVVADTATHVCSTASAEVVSALLPPAGGTTRARVSWDAALSTSTLVLSTPNGADVELVFVPE